jgi:hypothetical protein
MEWAGRVVKNFQAVDGRKRRWTDGTKKDCARNFKKIRDMGRARISRDHDRCMRNHADEIAG